MVKDTVQKLAEENARNLADRCFGSGSKGRRRFSSLLPLAAGGNEAAMQAGMKRWGELWANSQPQTVQIDVAALDAPTSVDAEREAVESSGPQNPVK